jgi:ectoine hydroxylase-related dioxygenase (phytanoyl-CoA dioxygenase family)
VVGRGALLSQLIGSVRPKGAPAIGLHADNSWFPAPFPEWDLLVTACWVTDEFTREGGSTLVIPGSHPACSHPTAEARKTLEGAVPIECDKGSLAIWNSRIWHSNYPRNEDGERVVLHMTYSRIGITPVEDYRHLGDDYLEGKPPELATLLGRNVFLGTTTAASGGTDAGLLRKTYETVHGPGLYTRARESPGE